MNQYHEIREVFKYIGSDGYRDDKIIIDNVKYEHYESAVTDCEGEMLVSGRIRLIDGTVLFDVENDIYHPGKWTVYVIELTKALKANREYELELRRAEIKRQEMQKVLEKKKLYNENHSPIDDSKYFK